MTEVLQKYEAGGRLKNREKVYAFLDYMFSLKKESRCKEEKCLFAYVWIGDCSQRDKWSIIW